MKKISIIACFLCLGLLVWAEGSESLQNVTKDVYGINSTHSYTGDNGMPWNTVGAIDCTVGGYRALTVSAGVANNGIKGQLNPTQVEEGVGEVTFYVKGIAAGTGYGDRTFRVTVGNKVVDVTRNIPNINTSCLYTAVIKRREVNDINITALETLTGETATFAIYNIQWTSYNGRTDKPTYSVEDENIDYTILNGDTTYYAPEYVYVHLQSTTDGAVFYYTTDGSIPTTSSATGEKIALPVGKEYNLRMIAWTDSLGTSDETTWTINTDKGMVYKNPCESTSYWQESSKVYTFDNSYETKSGTPCYRLATSTQIITPTIQHPHYLSLYATSPSKSVTVAYQTGVIVEENGTETWEAGEWTTLRTIAVSELTSGVMKYFQIDIPEELKTQTVRFRLKSSGNSSYVDDINYITPVITPLPTPTLSIASGEVAVGTSVTITGETGATLHYSINGGEEQIATSPVELTINETTILRAYATKEGWANSNTAQATYTIAGDPTAIDTNTIQEVTTHKILRNGQLYLIHKGTMYDARGVRIY